MNGIGGQANGFQEEVISKKLLKSEKELIKGAEVGVQGTDHIGREQQPPCVVWAGNSTNQCART